MLNTIKRQRLFFISLIGIVVVSLTMTATFAYQTLRVEEAEGANTGLTINVGNLEVNYTKTNKINLTNMSLLPDYKTADYIEFTIDNTLSTDDISYQINLTNLEYTESVVSEDFKYTITLSYENGFESVIGQGDFSSLSGNSKTLNFNLSSYRVLAKGTKETLKLYLWLKETEENQNVLENASFKGIIQVNSMFSSEINESIYSKFLVYGNSVQDTATLGEPSSTNIVPIESLGTKINLFDISWIMEKANSNHIELDGDSLILKNYANATGMTPERFLELTGLKEGDTVKTFFDLETIAGSSNNFLARIVFLAKDTSTYSHLYFTLKNGVSNIITIPEGFNSTNYGNMYIYGIHTADENGDRLAKVSNLVITKDTSLTEYVGYDKYAIPVNIKGKNLIPYPYVHTTKTTNGLTYTDNGDGSITVKGTATAASYFTFCTGIDFGEAINEGSTNGTYVTSENIKYSATNKAVSMNFAAGEVVDKTFYPQLEKGTVSTEYEPYATSPIYIQLDEPLRKIGDSVDYIDVLNNTLVRNVMVEDNTGTQLLENSYKKLEIPTYETLNISDIPYITPIEISVCSLNNVCATNYEIESNK